MRRVRRSPHAKVLFLALIALFSTPLFAADSLDIGLTAKGARIEGFAVSAPSKRATVLLIGGLKGDERSAQRVHEALAKFERTKAEKRGFNLIAIPLANPEGVPLQFPATGVAYRENAEANALWRWIGLHAPDLVLVEGDEDFGLAQALSANVVAEVGRIPARRVASRETRSRIDAKASRSFRSASGDGSAPRTHAPPARGRAREVLRTRFQSAALHPGHRADRADPARPSR